MILQEQQTAGWIDSDRYTVIVDAGDGWTLDAVTSSGRDSATDRQVCLFHHVASGTYRVIEIGREDFTLRHEGLDAGRAVSAFVNEGSLMVRTALGQGEYVTLPLAG